jgi:hypothetical protein
MFADIGDEMLGSNPASKSPRRLKSIPLTEPREVDLFKQSTDRSRRRTKCLLMTLSEHRDALNQCPLCAKSRHSALQQRKPPTIFTYTKALSPVIALPTINVFISRVPS